MRLLDVPMIKNHSYMMYLKNVSYPDRLSDLNWIFTKIKFLLFLQISLPNSLRICLQNKPKLQFFQFFHFLKPFLNLFASSSYYDLFTVLKCYDRLFIAEKLRSVCMKHIFLQRHKHTHKEGRQLFWLICFKHPLESAYEAHIPKQLYCLFVGMFVPL